MKKLNRGRAGDKERAAFSRRLRAVLDAREISQADVARASGIPLQSINNWCSGVSLPVGARIAALARGIGVPVEDVLTLLDPSKYNAVTTTRNPAKKIPRLTWEQAGNWGSDMDLVGAAVEVFDESTATLPAGAFSLEVAGDSMSPEFQPGAIIIVDPSRAPKDGSFVVAKLGDAPVATFKQLRIDGAQRFLVPTNDRYPVIEAGADCAIIGVVVEQQRRYG